MMTDLGICSSNKDYRQLNTLNMKCLAQKDQIENTIIALVCPNKLTTVPLSKNTKQYNRL